MPRVVPDSMDGAPVAVIGIGLRFPGGCDSPEEFAEFLAAGGSGIRPLPGDRFDVAAFTPSAPGEKGKIHTVGGGFLDRIDLFDALFFNISPKEAQYVDPQQRMVLETAWHALEHANIDPTPLRRGNGAVFIGASSIDYAMEIDALSYEELDGHLAAGMTMFPLSGRLSYFLGWRGPSASVDTACSSSLTALHFAVAALRNGETDIALCGGVNALHNPRAPIIFSDAQMLAPDARCKTFDDAADGYVRAEGCGIIVLKRLADARRDGDVVHAVVRGTAIGQDGDSAGLTVPNGAAQEQVMRNALADAGLKPEDIHYVEAHGTGTPLGDPIELGAINGVFGGSHSTERPLVVGSVKTNLGHMEPASGIVGVIKTILQLKTGTIYPHLNFTTPSGRIPWDSYHVHVPTTLEDWPAPVRRALVNSFGFAGAIGAAVLEDAPAIRRPPARTSGPAVFTISAKSPGSLRAQLESFRRFVAEHPEIGTDDLCRAVNTGRAHFPHRVAGAVTTRADLVRLLDREPAGRREPVRRTAFLFTGQGSQYPGMGTVLYDRHPVFRHWVDECDRLFRPLLGHSVWQLMSADDGSLDQTAYTQPALFTLEFALARLWQSWGVRPAALIGHSIGEVAAAAVAGLFTLPDAVTLVAARARLMQSVRTPGGMAAVAAPADDVLPLLAGRPGLAMAAVNAPEQCVVSGASGELDEVCAELAGRGVRVDRLKVSHAFHSPLMAEVFEEFRAAIDGIRFHEPSITLVSNVTGRVARLAEIGNADYWVRHIGEPVLFAAGLAALTRRGRHAFVEIGPSSALTALGRRCVPDSDDVWVTSLSRRDTTGETVARSLAELYTAGLPIAWPAVHAGRPRAPLSLPTYPFERRRYWLPIGAGKPVAAVPSGAAHPLLGTAVDPADGDAEFVTRCWAGQPGYVADHVVDGEPALPASAYLEIALAVQDRLFGRTDLAVEDLRLGDPLVLGDDPVELRTTVTRSGAGWDVRVHATNRVHATARLVRAPSEHVTIPPRSRPLSFRDGVDAHTDLDSAGLRFGARLRLLRSVSRHADGVVRAELTCRESTPDEQLPVEVLECAVRAAVAMEPDGSLTMTGVRRARLFKKPRSATLRMVATVRPDGVDRTGDLLLFEDAEPVAELLGVTWSPASDPLRRKRFQHELAWVPQPAGPAAGAERHVCLMPGATADVAPPDGMRVSFAAGVPELADLTADRSVTDVCWWWRGTTDPPTAESARAECERNYRELLDVVATLRACGPTRPPRLWLVTEGAHALPGDAAHDGGPLVSTSLWGFGTVLLNEAPQYQTTLVDAGIADLLREVAAPRPGEHQIAWRNGVRYVRRLVPAGAGPDWGADFEPAPAPRPEPADDATPAPIRPDRIYLVTGGLGGLGLVTARLLVDRGARHLVLVSRSGRPTEEAAQVLDQLSGRAEVTIVRADVSRADDVRRLFADLDGPVGGIVHAAGAIGKALVSELTWEAIDEQLAPKMYGALLLHDAAKSLPHLDFFVVYSSIAAVVGGATQAHYAAAGTFLDGLARWRADQGLPGLSVNWGAWARVGMSARLAEEFVAEIERGGVGFFSPARALDTLAGLLAGPAAQRVVGRFDWTHLAYAHPRPNALYARLVRGATEAADAVDLTDLLSKPDRERLAALGGIVREQVAGALRLDDADAVDDDAEFVSLGLDSLMAVELKTGLESVLRLPLPASLAFDHPTARRLTEFIDAQLTA